MRFVVQKCTTIITQNFYFPNKICPFGSARHAINAALAVFCGCLQMIAMAIDTFSTITKTQSKLHHSRACRETAALEMKTLRVMTKNTKENKSSEF